MLFALLAANSCLLQTFFNAFQYFGSYNTADNTPTSDFLNSGDVCECFYLAGPLQRAEASRYQSLRTVRMR